MHPTAALQRSIRRLALTTKQGPHNYYKGNRTGALGTHDKYGGYKIDWRKVRTYVCPDLGGFQLTPFVTRLIDQRRDDDEVDHERDDEVKKRDAPMDGQKYLEKWKEQARDSMAMGDQVV